MLFQTIFVLLGCFFIRTETFRTSLDTKIIHGTEVTDRSKYSYQALIYFNTTTLVCGASIIHEKYVLTAAQCVVKDHLSINPSHIKIVTGNLFLDDYTIIKDVETIYVHEDYDDSTVPYSNDIAIIQISGSFGPWTENVTSISLKLDETTSGSCTVSGWGRSTSDGSLSSPRLLSIEVPIVDWQTCNSVYLTTGDAGKPIPETVICARDIHQSPCEEGDGGDPMVCSDQLAGIASYGMLCGLLPVPWAYTEVAAFADWIENILPNTTTTTTTTTISTVTSTTTDASTTPDTKGFAVASRDSASFWLFAIVTILANLE